MKEGGGVERTRVKGVKFGQINRRKITKIKVEVMQTYKTNTFLRSFKNCLMLNIYTKQINPKKVLEGEYKENYCHA